MTRTYLGDPLRLLADKNPVLRLSASLAPAFEAIDAVASLGKTVRFPELIVGRS